MSSINYYRLSDMLNGSRHGSCTICGVASDKDDTLVRYTFNKTSICLCNNCRKMAIAVLRAGDEEARKTAIGGMHVKR